MNRDFAQLDRLLEAYQKARFDLLQERGAGGYWVGELATSALSTATAVSALSLANRRSSDEVRLQPLILGGLAWLARHQNDDGGWGDTVLSHSNIATTMLAAAAFRLTAVPARHAELLSRADAYIREQGGIRGLRRRYGRDKTFAVPILTNCALAGMVPWSEVAALPFELACFPQEMYRRLRLPVVSYAIPALVAIGQCRHHHRKPRNPLIRLIRDRSRQRSLDVLRRIQPASGGYLEAVPLTSFVVMSLASSDQVEHAVTRAGLDFIQRSVRADGSWPIDTNLATWNTTLAVNALATAGEDVHESANLDWLLDCQYRERHPYTGADPGGWGWSDLSGAVPDADDTPGALLALAAYRDGPGCSPATRKRISAAAEAGLDWLLNLQNSDGGWPTFCRGWGKLPFDRSGADLTAHALRSIAKWRSQLPSCDARCELAVQRGLAYLAKVQASDGSWLPLWFGNQDHPREENPVYGTAKVLLAYHDLGLHDRPEAVSGIRWLLANQNPDGGWGAGLSASFDREPSAKPLAAVRRPLARGKRKQPLAAAARSRPWAASSVEETALAVDSLCAFPVVDEASLAKGIEWLIAAVESNRHFEPAPIGFYFSKLWYYEKLYPIIFSVSALGRALARAGGSSPFAAETAHLAC